MFFFHQENMKFQQIILSMSFLLLLLPLLVVESSSFNDSNITANGMNDTSFSGNVITRGSSAISILWDNSSTYWPSSSGNFGFGFYSTCPSSIPDCPENFVVGIWFLKSPSVPMVWTTKHHYYKPSSVLLTNEGKFVLRTMPDDKEEPLIPSIQEPVAYAVMNDNGNFVLYGLHSQIVWQSFDYPTYMILGGQKLRSGVDLVAGGSRLSVEETNGSVAIYTQFSESLRVISVISDSLEGLLKRPIFLTLNTTGDLYLVGSDGVLLKYLYRNKKHQGEDHYLYRATLRSDGYFDLYKERIDGIIGDHEKSSILIQSWPSNTIFRREKFLIAVQVFGYLGLCLIFYSICYCAAKAVRARLNRSPVS